MATDLLTRPVADREQTEWNKFADAADVLAGRATYIEWPNDKSSQEFIAVRALGMMAEKRTILLTTQAYKVEQTGEI